MRTDSLKKKKIKQTEHLIIICYIYSLTAIYINYIIDNNFVEIKVK